MITNNIINKLYKNYQKYIIITRISIEIKIIQTKTVKLALIPK